MSLSSKLMLASALALGAAPALATAAPVAQVETVKASAKAPLAAQDDSKDYATREAKDQKAADFSGGSVVIIGLSGGALLVLLFLLLLI